MSQPPLFLRPVPPVPPRRYVKLDLAATAAKVQANLERLRACPGPHRFQTTTTRGEYRCPFCSGLARGDNAWFYTEGLRHGRAGGGADIPVCPPPAPDAPPPGGNGDPGN